MKMTIGTTMINRNHDENMFSRNSNDTRSSRPQLGLIQSWENTQLRNTSGNKPRFPEEKLTSGNIRGVGER